MVKDWNGAKSTIHHLYVTQEQGVEQVKEVMQKQHNFAASTRAYKLKIHDWGWRTNRDANGQIAPIRRRRRRQRIATDSHATISQVGGASFATARYTDSRWDIRTSRIYQPAAKKRRTLNSGASSGQPIGRDLNNPWTTPGSFNLGAMGQNYSPGTPGVDHAFNAPPQNIPLGFEPDIVDQQDILGSTLLHRMVTVGELDNVKYLLSRGASIDIQDNEGNQPLHLAAIANYSHIIRCLLKSGARVNAKGVNGRTPVHLALRFPETLRALLGAHPNLSTSDNDGDTALHAAVRGSPKKRSSNGDVIEKLLHRGANVNTLNHAGVTPFHMALEQISCDPKDSYVPIFLEHDADVQLRTGSGEWPFEVFLKNVWAFTHRWWSEMLVFLREGADPNTEVSEKGNVLYAMLNLATYWPDNPKSDVLLQLCKSANIHTPSAKGEFPLHCVMRPWVGEINIGRHLEFVKVLLDRGSEPNQQTGKGERPLQILLSNNVYHPGIEIALKNLLAKGADPMLIDSSGNLPVYIAYKRFTGSDRNELVKILTDAFVAPAVADDEGNDNQTSSAWWRTYRDLRLQKQWSDEASQLLEAASMPQDIAEHLPKLLLSFAAEEKLQAAKDFFKCLQEGIVFSGNSAQAETSHVLRILRDCKQSGIKVDLSWYHFLVDILP